MKGAKERGRLRMTITECSGERSRLNKENTGKQE